MRLQLPSLRVRLLAMPSLGFIVLLIVVGYLVLSQREARIAEAMGQLQVDAEQITEVQRDLIQYVEHLFVKVAAQGDIRRLRTIAGCQDLFAGIAALDKHIANFGIATPGGDLICSSNPTERIINIADRLHFQRALATPEVVIGASIISRVNGIFALPFAHAVRSDTGDLEYVVTAAVDLRWVSKELAKAKLPEGSRIGLVDSRGLVLARFPDSDKWVGKNVSDTPFFKKAVAQGGHAPFVESGFDAVPRIYGLTSFAKTTSGLIFLWIGVPADSVTGAIDRQALFVALAAFATLGLLFIGSWVSIERLLLRPILAISKASKRLSQGDHNASTGLSYTDDELGGLARTIDSMAIALMSKSEVLKLNRSLKAISSVNGVLIHANDESQLMHSVCNVIVNIAGYRLAWVGFVEHDANRTVRPVAYAGYQDGFIEQANISWADNEQGSGPAGTAIRTQKACVIQNAQTDSKYELWRDNAIKIGYGSVVAFPLAYEREVYGALCIYSSEFNGFDEDELRLLEELAGDLAFGIVTLRTRIAESQSAKRLINSVEATIAAVGSIVEMRDPYTAGHQTRVSNLCAAIAGGMGLTESEIHGIRLAATVHDLGKIQIPAEILAKPSRLTEIEYILIKGHAQAGYDILKNIDFPWPIAQIVYQHHERIDGSGYPRGLKGADILLGAKIMAVADTVEAMASHRPYRPGLGIEKAIDEITRNRGIFYDAQVVDTCVKLLSDGRFKF